MKNNKSSNNSVCSIGVRHNTGGEHQNNGSSVNCPAKKKKTVLDKNANEQQRKNRTSKKGT